MAKLKRKVLVLHGPNLNLLGRRQPDVYGADTLDDINLALTAHAQSLGLTLDVYQSNHEGDLVERIQSAVGQYDGIVINPAAYTHTSIAILDALLGVGLPAVEVHLSHIHSREQFRHQSRTVGGCIGLVAGFGKMSYILGLSGLHAQLYRG